MYYFFVNPASRAGNNTTKWAAVQAYMEQHNLPYDAFFLKDNIFPGPALQEIFEKEKDKPVSIIIVGGDGTVNHCINDIPDYTRVEFSVLPAGSGNDFCRNKDIPATIEEQLDNIIARKHTLLVDRGVVTYYKANGTDASYSFLVSTGFGYDAAICYMAERSFLKKVLNKLKLGKLVYLVIGIKEVFGAKLTDMDVTIDGITKKFQNVFFIATMNQPFEGGGVAMTPNASDTDGVLDFMLFHSKSKLKALMTIPLLYVKKHMGKPGVELMQGKAIKVTSSGERIVHRDGESEDGCLGFEARIDGKVKFIY